MEKLPRVAEDGSTTVAGLYVVGDLTGVPLLKFSAHTGAMAVRRIVEQSHFLAAKEKSTEDPSVYDVVILGAGVSGMAAALEAKRLGLKYLVLEASEPFSTILNFPKGKPIFTYPTEMTPAGEIQFEASVKEPLVEDLQVVSKDIEITPGRAERVISAKPFLKVEIAGAQPVLGCSVVVAIGRSGNFRKLGVPGEDLDKVYNRLHDPKDFCGQNVLVVGGGDSALETAIALAQCGSQVSVSYRKKEFSRPKPENLERLDKLIADPMAKVNLETPSSERVTTASGEFLDEHRKRGSITLLMGSAPQEITASSVRIKTEQGHEVELENDVVFSMIGREAPLEFFRRSGVAIHGETRGREWFWIGLFFLFVAFIYDWKGFGFFSKQFELFSANDVFPNNAPAVLAGLGQWWADKVSDRSTLLGTIAISMKSRSFYYTCVYTLLILVFGIARIRRRKTPYVTLQTSVLFLVQAIPLFLLPEVVLPWAGYNGMFDAGLGKTIADSLFEMYISAQQYAQHDWPDWGHPRAYWRAYGLILAWPLMVYNVFTDAPMTTWLVISLVQTFMIIPLLVYLYGKGAYCGWICSCGGLAETMGDTHRHKMPHGAGSNRLNMIGQLFLALAFLLLAMRVWGWLMPESYAAKSFALWLDGKNAAGQLVNPFSYKWVVDVLFGGIIGVGLYFKYSGRVWCRFACPLAALMHIYSRFSRFRIIADKKKCISCNQCTSVCHQGIDIMNFANKGLPMKDPQCVRCSACVQACPTGVLQFGSVYRDGSVRSLDKLAASPVLMAESKPKRPSS